jgi:UDP-GalNAc:undecaprenyl-phosphate GalNAc-1-phosphate transferase
MDINVIEKPAICVKEGLKTRSRLKKYTCLTPEQANKKRLLDLGILLISLPIVLPLAILTSIIIKIDSRGPVLFTQDRVGLLGRSFKMYKFRSMKLDSEENGSQFASKKDNRVTPFGRFIRKFRIDEIPQFYNVLIGDMSVIGPRPEQVSFVEYFEEEINDYDLRHSVKPGITGLAQVQQGYAACTRSTIHKLRYDLFYIKKYSTKLDLYIVIKTIRTILTGFGAR